MSPVVQRPEAGVVGPGSAMGLVAGEQFEADALEACLRTMRVVLKTIRAREPDADACANPSMRSLLRELGLLRSGESTIDESLVHERLDSALVGQAAMRCRVGMSMADIASELARVFEYEPSTRDLLELALHANRCKPLRRTLNLLRDMDEEDAAEFFAQVLGHDTESMAEALRRHIPFRAHEPFGIGFCRGMSAFHYLEFNSTATRVLRGQPTLEKMLAMFFRLSDKAKLRIGDFDHQGTEVGLLVQYVRQAMRAGRKGANVLL